MASVFFLKHFFKPSCHVKCIQYSLNIYLSGPQNASLMEVFKYFSMWPHISILVTGYLLWFKHKVNCPNRLTSFLQGAMHSHPFFFPYLYLSKLIKRKSPRNITIVHIYQAFTLLGSVLNASYAISHLVFTKFYEVFILLFL